MADRKQLLRGLNRLGLSLPGDAVDKVLRYCAELQKWNRRINLIARNTPDNEALEKHFLDSLTLLLPLEHYDGDNPTLLDVGTGAGFPGLVLAAVLPALQVTLVEPRQKRVSFLRHIVRTLNLDNVRIVAARLEQAGLNPGEFSFITGRAVADPDHFLAMVADTAGTETVVIILQAADDPSLWTEGSRAGTWQLLGQDRVELPFSGAPRLLSMVQKRKGVSAHG